MPAAVTPQWKIDEFAPYFDRMRLRGWCFAAGMEIVAVEVLFPTATGSVPLRSYGQPSPDVAAALDPAAHHCRFDEWVELPKAGDFTLRLRFANGQTWQSGSAYDNARAGDAGYACWQHFFELLRGFDSGDVLEIGSRARSGITRRHLVPEKLGYVGLDIMPGPNVDLVGDAHELSAIVGGRKFVAAFSLSVFEHLAMPWKVVLELNRALAAGGLVFVNTPQTWPLHDEPWDFWRFSIHSWPCLFNARTGFEIIRAGQGEPARVHPMWDAPVVRDMPLSPAYLGSNVIARKISETSLAWPVPTGIAAAGAYPPGEHSLSRA